MELEEKGNKDHLKVDEDQDGVTHVSTNEQIFGAIGTDGKWQI